MSYPSVYPSTYPASTFPIDSWTRVSSYATGALLAPAPYVPPSAGSQDYVTVQFYNTSLVSQGPLQFVNLTATLYYNAVGSWSMLVPYTDALWNQMMAGEFIVEVNWRGLFSFGGKCEQPGFQDSIPGAGGQSGPYITLSGADYLGLIANRIAYPSPGVAWNAQTSAATDPVSSMRLESAIKHYVNNNMGPATTSARRNSLLDIATDLARGPTVSYTVKFGSGVNLNLLDVIRALIASSNSSMGVNVKRNGKRLTFDVYIPRDLTGKAWFSESLGNLTAVSFYLTDPTVTNALVQGSGTTFIEKVATGRSQWNVIEQFSDSSSETDINNLNAGAQQTLSSGGFGPNMSATMADIPFLTFGRDYGLGDIVTIEVRPGATYSDVVTSVTLTADPSATPSMSVVPAIGNSSNTTATSQSVIDVLSARIRALEKKLATK
jgi:ReqiPepy6 Gp37-like protein